MFNIKQDWEPVVIRKRNTSGGGASARQNEVIKARQLGAPVTTERKYNAGTNKQRVPSATNAAKIEKETEDFHVPKVSIELKKRIQQARQAKGMTQGDLAKAICEKPDVVRDYESGKAIPNGAVIAKMERALGTKLRDSKK